MSNSDGYRADRDDQHNSADDVQLLVLRSQH
jgi:hypothetical protein